MQGRDYSLLDLEGVMALVVEAALAEIDEEMRKGGADQSNRPTAEGRADATPEREAPDACQGAADAPGTRAQAPA